MHKDFDALNIMRPDEEPRATETIPEIIALVQRLIDNGNAYVADNGDVMFAIDTFKQYGRLSGQNLEELEAGAVSKLRKPNAILLILSYGKSQNPVNLHGALRGGTVVPDGILNVLQ